MVISSHGTKNFRHQIPNTRIMPIRKPVGHTLMFSIRFILTSPTEPDRPLRLRSSVSSRFGYRIIKKYQPEKSPKTEVIVSHMSTKKAGKNIGKFCAVRLEPAIANRDVPRSARRRDLPSG